ncbi:MAG TPA: MgtC/SapB family protein [bacterium]|nr:MgtC/SapB family protein [bacterium]
MDLYPSTQEMVIRLILAALLGGLLGLEREWRKKPAGLRTHMMVSLGAATFTLIALDLYSFVAPGEGGRASVDPIRIVDAVATGIGFLGAGCIIQGRGSVQGLTTAGSLWLAGAIGLSAGGGLYLLAAAAIVIAVVILAVIGRLEARFQGH